MKRNTQEKYFLEMTSFPSGLKKIILHTTTGYVCRFVGKDYTVSINYKGPKKAAAVFRNHGPNFDDKKVFILQVLIILQ